MVFIAAPGFLTSPGPPLVKYASQLEHLPCNPDLLFCVISRCGLFMHQVSHEDEARTTLSRHTICTIWFLYLLLEWPPIGRVNNAHACHTCRCELSCSDKRLCSCHHWFVWVCTGSLGRWSL